MFSRRSFLQLLPLPIFFGDSFRKLAAFDKQSPVEVARRLFAELKTKSLTAYLDNATPEILRGQRRAFDRLLTIWEREGRRQELLDQLKIDSQEIARLDDRELVARWFAAVANPFEELRESFDSLSLKVVGELRENSRNVWVLYLLEVNGMQAMLRPGVLQLVYSSGAWQAAFSEPVQAIYVATVAAREVPRIKIVVLGHVLDENCIHFACRAECSFANGERVQPAFCCTWGRDTPEARKMKKVQYAPLKELLRAQLVPGLRAILADGEQLQAD